MEYNQEEKLMRTGDLAPWVAHLGCWTWAVVIAARGAGVVPPT